LWLTDGGTYLGMLRIFALFNTGQQLIPYRSRQLIGWDFVFWFHAILPSSIGFYFKQLGINGDLF
jgi:hypothetical protein